MTSTPGRAPDPKLIERELAEFTSEQLEDAVAYLALFDAPSAPLPKVAEAALQRFLGRFPEDVDNPQRLLQRAQQYFQEKPVSSALLAKLKPPPPASDTFKEH